jgi:CBS domain containing-hemolysin-like protein
MLPREEVFFLSASMTREEALEYVHRSGHSRFPFSPTGDIEDVSGIVLVKNLFHWLLSSPSSSIDWEAVTQDPLVVPESVELPQLMKTFQDTQRHLAIVVDEYGSVEGIVTLEDVLEEIVGDIRDESDLPADDFYKRADGALVVRGHVDLRRLCAALDIPWQPEFESATVGGLLTETLERIPVRGDTLDWNGYRLRVLGADRRRVRRVDIRKIED